MKKLIAIVMILYFCSTAFLNSVSASNMIEEGDDSKVSAISLDIKAKSAVLMEAKTGKILYEQNSKESLPPASITKIMTLLLVMEALDEGKIKETDLVTISDYASSMGGSQVFLAVGEQLTVRELLKCTVIASANDAAVALAEYTYGSEKAFVEAMNQRAKTLGLTGSSFENVTGLDDTTVNHFATANDIALMSRALINYPLIREFSSTWMDTIREGQFTLTNTNRLVRYYAGAIGLKTGSTEKAKFCLSAVAERDGMQLIAVVMGADTRDTRNSEAMRLLDYGFANYSVYEHIEENLKDLYVLKGEKDFVELYADKFCVVIPKGKKDKVTYEISLPNSIYSGILRNDEVGTITYTLDDETIGIAKVRAKDSVETITFGKMLKKMLQSFLHLN